MFRLTSISGKDSPYVVPCPSTSAMANKESGHHKKPKIKEQFQVFIGAISPRSPRSDYYEFPERCPPQLVITPPTRLTHQQSVCGVNSVSNTRELAFGAFDDGAGPALRKRQNAYRRQCAGRIVFTLIVFAVAAAVFVLRLKIYQQEQKLKENWMVSHG